MTFFYYNYLMNKPIEERIQKHIAIQEGGCWIWQGATTNGTPVIRLGDKVVSVRKQLAPTTNGPLLATCGHKRCVAPDHIGNRLSIPVRLRRMIGELHQDPCWYVDPGKLPNMDGTNARRVAYEHFIGPTRRDRLYTFCRLPGCFNPWHVTPEPVYEMTIELDEIEDCMGFILEGRDPTLLYDEPTIDAARRRIEEEGI